MPGINRCCLWSIACVAGVFWAASAFADPVYVIAKTAQIRSGKTSLDPVVATLQYGQALEVLAREGKWVLVRTDSGAKGWIFATKVSETKPSGAGNELAALGERFRRGDSGVTASAGARGLDKASESYADRVGITKQHRDAVDRMTGYKISDEDIQEFLKSGRLGEYAE
jgi:hypothetical protein